MDKVEGILSKLFIGAATLGGISCLARADYNLPLFIFVYFMWTYDPKEKYRIVGLLFVTLALDVVWIVYWYMNWNAPTLQHWNSAINAIVMFCSSANVLIKVIGIICLFLSSRRSSAEGMPGVGNFLNLR
eukprot:TRINITY_DN7367_c0_g1_i3.p1 TRINITY_DN7367_c0_g1~~TRINITY_DN7367_c0_g1_i3.p1  ORF type:complete len:130 (+),score=29.19 TRINITY_DN7367_c0_g1_i3:141-530(+)